MIPSGRFLCAVLALLGMVSAAEASSLQTQASNYTYDRNAPDAIPVNLTAEDSHSGTTSVLDAVVNLNSVGGGFADSIARATYGALKGGAQSFEPIPALGYTSASAESIVQDSVLVVDSTMNPGDAVSLVFVLAIDPASNITPDPFGTPFTYVCGYECAEAHATLQIGGGGGLNYLWDASVHSPNYQTLIVNTTVGATVDFSYSLTLQTLTFDTPGYTNFNVDFIDTAQLGIHPLSGTTQLQSASRFDYSSVPEPSSWLLAGLGLVCIFPFARRVRLSK
jgi:hypothetical protein